MEAGEAAQRGREMNGVGRAGCRIVAVYGWRGTAYTVTGSYTPPSVPEA